MSYATGYDFALLLARLALGIFFILARFRYFYDPSRPEDPWLNAARVDHLRWKLCTCGVVFPKAIAPAVAVVEVGAGIFIALGLLTHLAAFGLLIILVQATRCTAREKVGKQGPVDRIDWWSCYLWTVEPLYIILAIALMVAGGGALSLDAWLF